MAASVPTTQELAAQVRDGRLPSRAIAALLGLTLAFVDKWIAANLIRVAAGEPIVDEGGTFSLAEGQCLNVAAALAPRSARAREVISVAFLGGRVAEAGFDPAQLNATAKALGDFARTPLGLAALSAEADKLIADD
jgi:hypothetical protein